ncbi:MAG: hypothetical protein ACJA08_001688 [Cyclobacteriaceae bacterium]
MYQTKTKINMKQISLITLLAFGLFIVSCNDDNEETKGTLFLSLSVFEDLGSSFAYEGWVIVGGSPVSTGTFSITASGSLSQSTFNVEASDLSSATMFVLSIEPVPDSDPAPAATKVLSGAITNGEAVLSVDGVVGHSLNAAGSFFLRTPTDESDGNNNENDQYGICFGTPGMPPLPNFILPALTSTSGWAYEGWVVVDGKHISIGAFTAFNAVDWSDSFSGTNPGPPGTGRRFLQQCSFRCDFPFRCERKGGSHLSRACS